MDLTAFEAVPSLERVCVKQALDHHPTHTPLFGPIPCWPSQKEVAKHKASTALELLTEGRTAAKARRVLGAFALAAVHGLQLDDSAALCLCHSWWLPSCQMDMQLS
jgi:hypothetical protein